MPETLPVFPHLHPLTGEPIVALGFRRNGEPIWPIIGGAPDDEPGEGEGGGDGSGDGDDSDDGTGDGQSGGDGDGAGDGDGDLGDAGKQALDRMKSKWTAARTELREFKALGLSPADIKKIVDAKAKADGGGDDGQVDADKIREEARREARAEAAKERVEDKIEARAAKKFADASDAVAILLRTHDINDFLDGDKVDAEAISEALDELLEAKPHLAAAQGGKSKFGGGADGGARKASRPKQLTRDDLSRMKPEDIVKAKAEGRLDDLFKGK